MKKPKKETDDVIDAFTKRIFGISLSEALKAGVCVRCRRQMYAIPIYEAVVKSKDMVEYNRSGLCPQCIKEIKEKNINQRRKNGTKDNLS